MEFRLVLQAEDGIRDYKVTGVQTCAPSRRRHTRLQGDWSSDVCSSDLSSALEGTTRFCATPTTRPLCPRWRPGQAGRILFPALVRFVSLCHPRCIWWTKAVRADHRGRHKPGLSPPPAFPVFAAAGHPSLCPHQSSGCRCKSDRYWRASLGPPGLYTESSGSTQVLGSCCRRHFAASVASPAAFDKTQSPFSNHSP